MKWTRCGKFALGLLFILLFFVPTFGQATPITPGFSGRNPVQVLTNSDDIRTPLSDLQQKAVFKVTLITGDIVLVSVSSDGRESFAVQPVDQKEEFFSFKRGNDTYIVPSSAPLEKLDLNLFNIDYLLREKYYGLAYFPVLVSSDSASNAQSVVSDAKISGSVTRVFKTIPAFAARPKIAEVRALYQNLVVKPEVKKIWLDKVNHASLNESVPLIGAPTVWATGYDGTGVKIAILDTGIDSTHPDVSGRIVAATDFTDDGTTDDLYGHGTHVAVIAAGNGAASGGKFKGVAPGASLMNVKVLDRYGFGYDSWIISGIEYATDNGANLISMSLGGGPSDGNDPLSLAVDAAVNSGVVVSVAAGNAGASGYFTVSTPGAARQAITVGASDKSNILASFSGLGPTLDFRVKPDVLAPGVSIISGHAANGGFSSIPNPPGQPSSGPPNYPPYYTSLSGTSMATPHVSGLIALIKQKNPTWKPAFVKDALINTAMQLNSYNVYQQGGGRVYAPDAVQTTMLMDPGSYSFGALSAGLTSAYSDFAVYNFGGSTLTVSSLSIALVDVVTGITYSSSVTLNVTSLSVPSGSSKGVRLTINLQSVPVSLYSGLMIATPTVGKAIHSVFGFAKLNQLQVTKVDLDGVPAVGDWVYVFKKSTSSQLQWALSNAVGYTDSGGKFTAYVGGGDHTLVSFGGQTFGKKGIEVLTIADTVPIVASPTSVTLDERTTNTVAFDMNKAGLLLASSAVQLYYIVGSWWQWLWFYSILQYPSASTFRVSSTAMNATFHYSYFPSSAYDLGNPSNVNSPEWYDLLYASSGITGSTNYQADYSTIVQKSSTYSVNLSPKIGANRFSLVYTKQFDVNGMTPSWYANIAMNWQMTLPQARVEYVSPNTYYDQYLQKVSDLPGKMTPSIYYGGPWESWGVGQKVSEVWNSALSTNLYGYTDPSNGYVEFYGHAFKDSYRHNFAEYDRYPAGTITILKGAQTLVSNQQIGDSYDYWFYTGAGTYTVNIDGTNNQALSMHTTASFTLNVPSALGDVYAPLILFRPQGLDLNNSISAGNVVLDIGVADPYVATTATLQYSIDDGVTWNSLTLVPIGANWYSGNLGSLQSAYVSLKSTASDTAGNTVSQTTIRAFRVGGGYGALHISDLGPAVVNANGATVSFVLPDYTDFHPVYPPMHTPAGKCGGVGSAELSDYSAGGYVLALVSNQQNQLLDTNSAISNGQSDCGSPVGISGTIVTLAGPGVNKVVHYYEQVADITPVYFLWDGSRNNFVVRATGQRYIVPNAKGMTTAGDDLFLVEAFTDGQGRRVFVLYGFSWEGTLAAGAFFASQIYPHMSQFSNAWYIYRWTDATSGTSSNSFPDAGDQYTLIISSG